MRHRPSLLRHTVVVVRAVVRGGTLPERHPNARPIQKEVTYEVIVRGIFAQLFSFKHFPFDDQEIEFLIVSLDPTVEWVSQREHQELEQDGVFFSVKVHMPPIPHQCSTHAPLIMIPSLPSRHAELVSGRRSRCGGPLKGSALLWRDHH